MTHEIRGNWSIRAFQTEKDRTGYHVFRAGARHHWGIKATLWPASDDRSFVISMDRRPLDARPTKKAALDFVIGILDGSPDNG